jgi:alpha-L-fucosidase
MAVDPIQYEFDRVFESIKEDHPEYSYFQQEAILNSFLSSQMSKFRHRKNNPQDYTGIIYDPEGKLKIPDEEPIDEKDVVFFSSRIEAC